ncbi:MAG TPA: 50S ribosomal protein L4 [Desulfomonilia bacterium]|jgi:large subunit ribosomal protein L4|nr:50S ribosomal protein L4 [Thermodesulfobacteriota bacterium]HWR69202.1 50S ribosomal protein L4 [Desulfomonilia bacterium]
MPVVDVFNIAGEKVKEIQLDESVFGCEVKPHLLHDVVLWQRANRRAATAKTKSRSEVSGGGKKPWRQKGTGRARAGTNRSPLWRHGGVVFGPNGRSYKMDLPKKVRKQALCSALSMKTSENMLKVVDAMDFAEPKTKEYVKALGALGMQNSLVVVGQENPNVAMASRNHPKSKLLNVGGLNVYDILKYKGLVIDLKALELIVERLKP